MIPLIFSGAFPEPFGPRSNISLSTEHISLARTLLVLNQLQISGSFSNSPEKVPEESCASFPELFETC
jgi:hypothetical protein